MLGTDLPLVFVHGNFETGIPAQEIQASGAKIIHLVVEMEYAAEWESRWNDDLAAAPPDFTVFTGACEVKRLVELLGKDTAPRFTRQTCVVATDSSIENMLKKFGLFCAIKLNSSKIGDLVRAMADYLK